MNNKQAIKELEALRTWLYGFSENYIDECGSKNAKELTDNLQQKIYAIDLALMLIQSIDSLTKEKV